jgi:hypothetical protein
VIYRYLDCGDLHNGFARSKKASVTSGNPHLKSKSKTLDSYVETVIPVVGDLEKSVIGYFVTYIFL